MGTSKRTTHLSAQEFLKKEGHYDNHKWTDKEVASMMISYHIEQCKSFTERLKVLIEEIRCEAYNKALEHGQ